MARWSEHAQAIKGAWRPGRVALAALVVLAALSACTQQRVPEPPPVAQAPPEDALPPLPPPPSTDRLGRPIDPNVTRVALLLPLTGRGGEVGPKMLQAAEMALFDVRAENFELMPRDTRGTPEGAAAAARDVLADGAQLILGPLFSQSVRPVSEAAVPAGVNVISFTTDSGVAGGNVLVMGFLPSGQVDRVIGYAASQGLTRYAILAPESPYSRTVASVMTEAAGRHGGQLVATEFYNPDAPEFSGPVQRLAAAGQFDAVMLPETGMRLRSIGSLLPFYNLNDVRILGTGLWDGQAIGAEPSLIGAWYASSDPELRAGFERRYQENYGEPPPRLATLAYDAVALAAVLACSPGAVDYDMAVLTDPSGFVGVAGIFRFSRDGLVERGLAVLEVTADNARVIDPAPRTFPVAGF